MGNSNAASELEALLGLRIVAAAEIGNFTEAAEQSAKCAAATWALIWQTLADEAAWTFRGDLHGTFRSRGVSMIDNTAYMLCIPSGWLRQ